MKKLVVLLVLVGVVLAAGAYWLNHARPGANGEESYTLAKVEYGTMTETVSATGVLQPSEILAVGSELSGRVVEIYPGAEINKVVQDGDPLLKLDDRPAREKLEQAQVAVSVARAGVGMAEANREAAALKVKRLKEQPEDVRFKKELDEAKMLLKAADAAVAAAQARVEEAKVAQKQAQYGLDLTVVRVRGGAGQGSNSPAKKRQFTILDRKVVLGQLIGPPASAQLFTLASDLSQMQVHAQVSENDIGKLGPGLSATFSVYAYPAEEVRFNGKVAEIRPMPTSLQGAVFYDTIIDTANQRDEKIKEWRLRPGMTASVDIVLRQHRDAWKMPTASLSFLPDDQHQSVNARAKLAQWQERGERDDWKPVWILDQHNRPWPVFVRITGKNAAGESGIQESEFSEVLDWDPELEPRPDPRSPATYPQVITGAPPSTKHGFFDRPSLKLF